jgi:hypothetical protein
MNTGTLLLLFVPMLLLIVLSLINYLFHAFSTDSPTSHSSGGKNS